MQGARVRSVVRGLYSTGLRQLRLSTTKLKKKKKRISLIVNILKARHSSGQYLVSNVLLLHQFRADKLGNKGYGPCDNYTAWF